jgi:hypothetical protein
MSQDKGLALDVYGMSRMLTAESTGVVNKEDLDGSKEVDRYTLVQRHCSSVQ